MAETKTGGRVVALGNFDGVHTGHRTLLDEARRIGDEIGLPVSVWSFHDLPGPFLTPPDVRASLLKRAGADEVIYESFSRVKDLSPRRFVGEVLRDGLSAAVCVCGFNYTFGQNAAGDAGTLRALCAEVGIGCRIVPGFYRDGAAVSSSRIRALLRDGRTEEAAALLGRPYELTGPVENGRHIGRTLSAPTVNQRLPEGQCLPGNGVYATRCEIGGIRFPSVTNVGLAPTVRNDGRVTVETHILRFEGDLYGKTVTVGFGPRLRDEKRFPSEEALREAIARDAERAEAIFAEAAF